MSILSRDRSWQLSLFKKYCYFCTIIAVWVTAQLFSSPRRMSGRALLKLTHHRLQTLGSTWKNNNDVTRFSLYISTQQQNVVSWYISKWMTKLVNLKRTLWKDLAPLTFHTKYSQTWDDRLIEGQLLNRGSTVIWILFAYIGYGHLFFCKRFSKR